jgi:phosphoglycolate phosphatase-like HAD superfamily hydrolase
VPPAEPSAAADADDDASLVLAHRVGLSLGVAQLAANRPLDEDGHEVPDRRARPSLELVPDRGLDVGRILVELLGEHIAQPADLDLFADVSLGCVVVGLVRAHRLVHRDTVRIPSFALSSRRGGGVDAEGAAATKPVAVLFDIDETLVHTGGSGARSWNAAFEKLFGVGADIGEHTSAGETDPQVARETFRGVLGREPAADELSALYARYLMHLADDIWTSRGYRVLPGVQDLLVRLGDSGVILGIVSGAMEGAARTKLMPANLNRFFLFGAYGSDSPDRPELTRLAIDKAARLHGELVPAQVFVLGDTPRDVEAANDAGAVSMGVATGRYSVDELSAAGAAHVVRSLEDAFPGV